MSLLKFKGAPCFPVYIIIGRQRSCGKVLLLVMSVCPLGWAHVTITHDAIDHFTVQDPPPLARVLVLVPLSIQGPQPPSPYRDPSPHHMGIPPSLALVLQGPAPDMFKLGSVCLSASGQLAFD